MIQLPEIALGAVGAALITALVSWLSLIISKEQKTSEFRQAWIDALRADIAAVVAHANAIHGVAAAQYETPKDTWEMARDHYVGINQATANIRLRLNANEKECQAVINSIEKLEAHMPLGRLDFREIDAIEKQLVADAQALLKKEWLRVRNGEPVFRNTKRTFIAVLVVGVAFVVYHFVSAGG